VCIYYTSVPADGRVCYQHMPIAKVWIYHLLFVFFVFFVFLLCVCTVTDFSAEDKASGVKFCSAVHRRPRQGITHFVNFVPRSPKSKESASARATPASLTFPGNI